MTATQVAERSNVFRTINSRPIRWADQSGVVHACEGADVHPGVRLLWTLCNRDVPANKAFLPCAGEHFEMCAICLKRLNDEQPKK